MFNWQAIEHNFKKQLGFQETSKQAGSNTQEVEAKLNQGGHWPCEGASCLGWWLRGGGHQAGVAPVKKLDQLTAGGPHGKEGGGDGEREQGKWVKELRRV